MNKRRLLIRLFQLQLRRGWNQWQGLGWGSGWSLSIGLGLGVLSLIGTHLVLAAFVQRLLDPESAQSLLGPLRYTRYEDVADASARLMILFLSSTLLSSLCLKWGQWQSLQQDAEWDWFAEQPVPALPLFIHRCLVESFLPQPLALFVLPFFTVLAWQRGVSIPLALLQACAWVLLLQALVAAPRWCFDLWLRKMLSSTQVRTLRAGSSLIGVALLFVSLQCLTSEPGLAGTLVRSVRNFWDRTPIGLAVSAALCHGQGIAGLLMIILCMHVGCYGAAAWMLREPLPQNAGWSGTRGLPLPRNRAMHRFWDRLHPLTRRDLRLLVRDRHFLFQVLIGPLLFALLPLGLTPPVWRQHAAAILFTLAFIAGLLFLLGAVFYILPMEGRSIWMLYTWPQTLSQFLRRRLQNLLGLASALSLLVLVFGAYQQNLWPWLAIGRMIYVLWGLGCFAAILTAVAVFDYRPEQNDRPSLFRSSGILMLGGLYAGFLFSSDPGQSLGMMLLLAVMAAAFWWHMETVLPALLDRQTSRIGSPRSLFVTGMVALFILGSSLVWLGSHA